MIVCDSRAEAFLHTFCRERRVADNNRSQNTRQVLLDEAMRLLYTNLPFVRYEFMAEHGPSYIKASPILQGLVFRNCDRIDRLLAMAEEIHSVNKSQATPEVIKINNHLKNSSQTLRLCVSHFLDNQTADEEQVRRWIVDATKVIVKSCKKTEKIVAEMPKSRRSKILTRRR